MSDRAGTDEACRRDERPAQVPHMSPEQFRALGHRMVDWIADYWKKVERFPVRSQVRPGEIASKLPAHAPEPIPENCEATWDAIFRDLNEIVMPGITHWQHPNFFAYFPANASGPSVLGELLSAGLGVQGMLWATSPACTEIETRVLDWLAEMIDLPTEFHSSGPGGGVIQGTASEAALAAMAAARARVRAGGVDPGRAGGLVAYASSQAHSSIAKAAMIAGIATGPDDTVNMRLIGTDRSFGMNVDELRRAMRDDLNAGRTPFFVCASIGTTGCTAIDPLEHIGQAINGLGAAARPWLHADAAHAGAACICPEFRWMLRGVGHADSICFNPHKWLLVNFDCNCFWTRDRASLIRAMSITPEYLRNQATETGQVIDYRDWHVPLGRRFRALKLWFVIRHYGAEGLRAYVREHMEWAARLERAVRDDERFEIVAPRTMNLVCFRLRPLPGEAPGQTDDRNRRLLESLNATGRAYLTHTTLALDAAPSASYVLRFAIGSSSTREHHVEQTWRLIQSLA